MTHPSITNPNSREKQEGTEFDLAKLVFNDHLLTLLQQRQSDIVVIGIDGPTAVGKTILADCLGDIISESGRPVWFYRLDWALADRSSRLADLQNLRSQKVEHFPFEAELHMHCNIARQFLLDVRTYHQGLKQGTAINSKTIVLEGLYSRSDGGRTVGSETCVLQPGLVILVEGHYTGKTEIDELIDFNILLLGDCDELLARKKERVSNYRESDQAEDYFHRIDVPSFAHHLARYRANFDLVIDNTDYRAPRVEPLSKAQEWLEKNADLPDSEVLDFDAFSDKIFWNSTLIDPALRDACRATLDLLINWDRHVADCLRLSILDVEVDLLSKASELTEKLGKQFAEHGLEFCVKHTNSLHSVYFRKLPLSLGISITRSARSLMDFIADVSHSKLSLRAIWDGGCVTFEMVREIGTLLEDKSAKVGTVTLDPGKRPVRGRSIRVMTPTAFAIPSFMDGFCDQPIVIGREDENISASEAFSWFLRDGGVWIHRFPKFSEIKFFRNIVARSGGATVQVGNYLISFRVADDTLRKRFSRFREEWTPSVLSHMNLQVDEMAHDHMVDQEREALRLVLEEECPNFLLLDGYLHSASIRGSSEQQSSIIKQLCIMLRHPVRYVRKRAINFISYEFPSFSLPVTKLWDDVPTESAVRISLTNFIKLSPSILAELYLWLAVRDEPSAVLGANIYDIRDNSSDCRAYLNAASSAGAPIVLQASLNALGHAEQMDGKTYRGYLRPENGALDLVAAAMNAVRDLYLLDGISPPLFGIGLDHVAANNDFPPGRAKRFLENALASRLVTHFVADGSSLFSVSDRSETALRQAYERVVSFALDLCKNNCWSPLHDLEVCAGELNYCGDAAEAMIPTPKEMELFANIFREQARIAGLGAVNVRPTLFIGNLGTTHHGSDTGRIQVEISREWRDRLKRQNFVSPVLHGTTNSAPDVLRLATIGCHKVNVAGDFLRTFENNLPLELQSRLRPGDAKYRIADIRGDLSSMTDSQTQILIDSLTTHCREILKTVNAPKLSSQDQDYFRYIPFVFTERQIDAIAEELHRELAERGVATVGGVTDLEVEYEFSASMIEVPFDDKYKELVAALWDEGVRRFHIDVGDGLFIPRHISALDKVQFLRTNYPDSVIHAHLMARNPHRSGKHGNSLINSYISSGCNAVAIHRRAFSHDDDLHAAFKQIRDLGARPGLIIETSQGIDEELWSLICEADLDWVVVMGVPVGFGGQVFDMSVPHRIKALHDLALRDSRQFLIEVDGGLTFDTLPLCQKAGAQVFAGWSIVRAGSLEGVSKNVRALLHILKSQNV